MHSFGEQVKMVSVLDILFMVLPILLVYGMKPVVPFTSFNKNYNSITTSKNLRGLLSLTIVMHHLALRTTGGILFHQLYRVGFLPVAMFFYYSGYGVQKSYMASSAYKRHFLLRRIPPILFTYMIVTALFWIMYAAQGKLLSVRDIILAIIKGDPIVSYSWYIITIFIFYFIFWLLMITFGSNYIGMIVGACVWDALYVIFCVKMGYGSWWYNASHLLVVGMIWAVYEEKIMYFVQKRYIILALLIWGTFSGLLLFKDHLGNDTLWNILTMICSVLFVFSVLAFTMKFKIGNPVLNFLGKSSLEIYLVQGLFIQGLRSNTVYIQNEALWCLLVIAGSIALGTVLNCLLGIPLNKYNIFWRNGV